MKRAVRPWGAAVVWLAGVAACLTGCEERQRLNPLDPLNPVTRGRPTGVRVVSEMHDITVSWEPIAVEGMVGYRLHRRIAGEGLFQLVSEVSADSCLFRDHRRPFGVVHEYCVSALAGDYESPCSAPVSITPGPTFCWVVSSYDGSVVRLTHDRRHELLRYKSMAYPWIVEADPVTGSAWVVDAIYGSVTEVTASGSERVRLGWFRQPSDIALDPRRRHLWITEQASTDSAVVHKFTTDGTLIFTRAGLVSPSRLAIDTKTGSCFVADTRAQKVLRVAGNGQLSQVAEKLVWPTGLACDPQSGQLWIADATQVLRLSLRTGTLAQAEGPFVRAYVAAANDSTGECWVVDLGPLAGQAQVVRLTSDGRRVASYGPFVQPYGVTVNIYDGCCIVADTGADKLVEIAPDGTMQPLPIQVARPWDTVVENHYPLR